MKTLEECMEYCDRAERQAQELSGKATLKGDPDEASHYFGMAQAYADVAARIARTMPRVHEPRTTGRASSPSAPRPCTCVNP